jgi:hypothetical protein
MGNATAPAIDADELRADLDGFMDQEVRDPTGRPWALRLGRAVRH